MADKALNVILSSGDLTNIQLGSVNSTEKVLTQAEIDAKLLITSPTSTKYVPQDPTPSYQEGQVFYNDVKGTFDVQGKYSDVTLQVGREQHLEVTNNTAGIITNGQAVTQTGVLDGRPTVKLAIADTFDNARIIGIATHSIGIGETGVVTTFGEVGGLNSLGVTTGIPLYLSDTVPGALVETPPDIISRIGGMMVASETDGSLFVLVINNKNLPSVFGGMQGQTDAGLYNVTATPQDIVNYDTTKEVVVTVDPLTGEITSANSGEYRMHFSASITFPSTTSTRSITIELYDVTGADIVFSFVKNIPRDAIEDGLSFSYPIDQLEGNVDKLRIKSSTPIDITFTDISFDMESVNIR